MKKRGICRLSIATGWVTALALFFLCLFPSFGFSSPGSDSNLSGAKCALLVADSHIVTVALDAAEIMEGEEEDDLEERAGLFLLCRLPSACFEYSALSVTCRDVGLDARWLICCPLRI